MVAQPKHIEIVRVVDTGTGDTYELTHAVRKPSESCNIALLALCTALATRNYVKGNIRSRRQF